jgi:hypothetical protein
MAISTVGKSTSERRAGMNAVGCGAAFIPELMA